MKHPTLIAACLLFSSGARGFTQLHQHNSHKVTNAFRNPNPRSVPSITKLHAWSPFGTKTPSTTPNTPPSLPEKSEPSPLTTQNYIAAGVWISLITWALLLAPGTPGSTSDNELITLLISQPVPRPSSVNELWYAIWNSFTIVPAVIATLTAPTGRGQRLPAAPFLWGSAFFGYFSLGPYFATRSEREVVRVEDLGWASRSIFESRWFALVLLGVSLSIPVTSELLVPGFDWGSKVTELSTMISESRFVAVATADIIIMSILSSILVGEDCRFRGWDDKSALVSLATLLLPVIGPTLYLAARPRLEE